MWFPGKGIHSRGTDMTNSAGDVRGRARAVRPNRAQLTWDLGPDREAWLPADHVARLVWSFVVTLDLAALYDKVAAREGVAPMTIA